MVTHQGDEASACCELLSFIIVKLINGGELKNILNNLYNDFKCDIESVNILAKSEKEGDVFALLSLLFFGYEK